MDLLPDRMTLRIAKMLAVEEKYQSVKDRVGSSSAYDSWNTSSGLQKNLMVTNIITMVMGSFFSAMLGLGAMFAIWSGERIYTVSGAFFVLLLIEFVMAFSTTATLFSTLTDLSLVDPLTTLPIPADNIKKAITLSWFLYNNGLGLFFFVIPATVMCAFAAGSVLLLVLGLVWGLVFLLLGHAMGLLASSMLRSGQTGGKRPKAIMKRVLSILTMFLMMFMIQLLAPLQVFLAGAFASMGVGIAGLWVIFPFTPAYSIMLCVGGYPPIWVLAISFAYICLFLYLFSKSMDWFWAKLSEPTFETSSENVEYVPSSFWTRGPIVGIAKKDIHLVVRKPALAAYFMLPLLVVLPYLMNMITMHMTYDPVMVLFLLTGVAVMTSIQSTQLFVTEGKSAWFLFIQPISRRDLIIGKMTAGIVPALIYIPLVVTVLGLVSAMDPFTIMGLMMAGIMSVAYLLMLSLTIVERQLPEDRTVISQSSYGTLQVIGLLVIVAIAGYGPLGAVVLLNFMLGLPAMGAVAFAGIVDTWLFFVIYQILR